MYSIDDVPKYRLENVSKFKFTPTKKGSKIINLSGSGEIYSESNIRYFSFLLRYSDHLNIHYICNLPIALGDAENISKDLMNSMRFDSNQFALESSREFSFGESTS